MSKESVVITTCLLAAVVFVVLTGGCGRDSSVSIETAPSGAAINVNGKFAGTAPAVVSLPADGARLAIEFAAEDAEKAAAKKLDRVLNAAYLPLTANLPLFVALDRGYFERNGVSVKAVEATSPNDIVTGLVSGSIDFSAVLAYSIIFPAALRFPGSFQLFNSSEETGSAYTSNIIVPVDSPLKSYKELRGKKIGVYTGLVQVNFLKAMLTGMGISPAEVEIVEISPRLQIQGLVSGEYDALSTTEPTSNIAEKQGIARVLVASPRTRFIMCPFPSTAATVSTRLLEESPDAAHAVVQALNMAIDFIEEHPEEAKKTLLKYTPIPADNADAVLNDLKLFRYCKLGEENRLNVQRFADFLSDNGIMKGRIDDVNELFGDYQVDCPRE